MIELRINQLNFWAQQESYIYSKELPDDEASLSYDILVMWFRDVLLGHFELFVKILWF